MFTISVRLVHGVYEATSNEAPDQGEWPPHPARLFSGLVSVAASPADIAALEWLETLAPPTINASDSDSVVISQHSNYVITNETVKNKSHMEFAGRAASGKRTWTRVCPQNDRVAFTWAADPANHASALAAMTHRLPYLGRSTTPVVASFDLDSAADSAAAMWVPDETGTAELSVAHPGLRSALAAAFEHGLRPWTVARRWSRYRDPAVEHPEADIDIWPSAFDHFIVFGIEGRARPAYQSLVRYTTAFRNAVINEIDRSGAGPVPLELHGHAAPGETLPRHRVMFTGLPFVGSEHADGHLLGFAVCVPAAMPAESRASLYRGLLGVEALFANNVARVRLTRQARPAQTLNPNRWCAPSSTWISAYPIVLDRHVTEPAEVAALIRSACRHLDLPDPLDIDVSPNGLLGGADRLRPNQLVRRHGERARPALHAQITFAQPVVGPLVLGNMRHLGLGLMLPAREREA